MRLERPIGILTSADDFTELIPAGTETPHTFEDAFANGEDGQSAIQIELGQRDETGDERVASIVIDELPPRPRGTLRVTITIAVDGNKSLTLTASVPDADYHRLFGPYPVR